MYLLLTSLDPLTMYLYDDGLVRIATEAYTEHPDSVGSACVHVTNFAVNVTNEDKFRHSSSADGSDGHKVNAVPQPNET